jgi:serine/threonine protein kinase
MVLDIQDITASISAPSLIKDGFIRNGSFQRLSNGDPVAYVGGFSIVFKVKVNGNLWAFRCWHNTLDDAQSRIKCISEWLKHSGLPYFVDLDYSDQGIIVNGQVYPTTRMEWIDGQNIKEYICHHHNDKHRLFELALSFYKMTQDLHKQRIAHGDLQHGNILVSESGKLFLVDYDSMYVPAMGNSFRDTIKGIADYQHPSRRQNRTSSEKLDYFSEVVILISILAIAYKPELIKEYDFENSESMLFNKNDFVSFSKSKIYKELSQLGEIFQVFLKVMSNYLKITDINDLPPLENAINQVCPTNIICIPEYLRDAEKTMIKTTEAQIEETEWNKAKSRNTSKAYSDFIKLYPYSSHTDEAKKSIKRIKEISDENRAWGIASKANTIQSFERYLSDYPSSIHTTEANKKLTELKRQKKSRIAKILILMAITMLAAICINQFMTQPHTSTRIDKSTIPANTYSTTPKTNQTTTKNTNVEINHNEENNNVESVNKSEDKTIDVVAIERKLEKKIKGMEIAKQNGDPVNPEILREARSLLNEIEFSSSKYSSFRDRINNLIQ